MDPKELMQRRAKAIADARSLLDKAKAEKRDLTDEERSAYDTLVRTADGLEADIRRCEGLAQREASLLVGAGPARPDPNELGMGPTDLRQYSLVRAIRAAASAASGQQNAWNEAGLELEASREIAKRLGREPQGFFVPLDVQRQAIPVARRDLNVANATQGGNLVATELLSQSFIELLRNRMVVRQAGATILGGLVGDIAIPRQTGGATAYWVAEGNAPTESQQAVDQVALTPHTVGAFTDYTRKMLKQSSIDVESFVRTDLATVLALAIDLAALHGNHVTDANQPDGIAATSGIGSVAGGENGAAPTWAHIVQLETEVAQDNADVGRVAYITNAKVRGKLKVTPRVTGTETMIWDNGATPLNGYPALVSNQVASNLVKGGSGAVCSAIFFGNWGDLIIGMWGTLDVLVDPYTGSTSGTVRIVTLQDVDIAVRHAESFAAMLDALTS